MLLPLLLAVAGAALIIVGQLDLDRPPSSGSSLPPIEDPTPTPVAVGSPTPAPSDGETPAPTPEPTPIPPGWHAVQMQIESVGINVRVRKSTSVDTDSFPPDDAAYILRNSSQPGRGTNSYIFAHAVSHLFKPLWNIQVGARIKVLMSDGVVLRYVVTEVHPNVSCPAPDADPNPSPPPALRYAGPGCEDGVTWTQPVDHERLTLQTSQGYNRNYGELVIVAEPVG